MQIIGFNFTKISGEKIEKSLSPNTKKTLDFRFDEIEQEKAVDFLKDSSAIKVLFKHTLHYEPIDSQQKEKKKNLKKEAELTFEGNLLLSLNFKEAEEINKLWKKKQISPEMRIFLSNFILSKCTPKTLELQQLLNIPSHLSLPRLNLNKQENN